MNNHEYNLSSTRKKHHLQLSDVAELLKVNKGNLSSQENGNLQPTIKTLTGYSILFGTKLPLVSGTYQDELQDEIIHNATILKERLKKGEGYKTAHRLKALETIIDRLLQDSYNYEYEA